MKILYGSGNLLVSTTTGGGAATQIVGFVSELEKAGHEVDLDVSGEQKLYPKIRTSSWLDWVREHVSLSWLGYEILQMMNNRKIYRRLMDAKIHRYDLVWQRYELFTTAYAQAARTAGIKHVFFVDAPMIRERKEYAHLWLEGRARSAMKFNVDNADLVIAVSDEIAAYVHEVMGTNKVDVKVIPNGFSDHLLVDHSEEVQSIRDQLFPGYQGIIMGFAGSPKVWHRLDYFMRAIRKLADAGHDFRVLIVGDGPDLPKQKKLANDLGLLPLVKFTGQITFTEMAPYLQAMDIGVMPDSNLYGSPMKIAEYMACGAVVVAPNLPPIANFCRNEVDGLLFTKDDEEALCNALSRLLASPEFVAVLRQNGRQRAQEEFTWQGRIQQINKLLSRLPARSKEQG